MKVLAAISSCVRDVLNGSNAAIRQTWAASPPAGWDVRFFVGNQSLTGYDVPLTSPGTLGTLAVALPTTLTPQRIDPEPDEIVLNVPDHYLGLPWKTVESLKWAMARSYDFVLRCFTDTYVFTDRMAKSGFEGYNAVGWTFSCGPCPAHPYSAHSCPLGGAGYWLSRAAVQAVISAPAIRHWGEDTHVGYVLHNAGIFLVNDARYIYNGMATPLENRSKLTIHLNDRMTKWDPALMLRTHEEQQKGRMLLPNWQGVCKRCHGTKISRHPLGLRCKDCGTWVGR